MGRSKLGPVSLVLLLLLPGMAAVAQSSLRTFDLERLDLNPSAMGSLVVGTGELLEAGQYRFSAVGQYAHRPLLFHYDGSDYELIGGRTTMHVAAAVGLTNWLQVAAQLPVVVTQQFGVLPSPDLFSAKSSGLGTPTLSVALSLLPLVQGSGFDLALQADVGLPVGSAESFASDGGLRYMPSLMVGRHFGFIRAALDAGFMVRPGGRISFASTDPLDELGNELHLGLALSTTGSRLRGEFNVRGMMPLSRQSGAAELLPGVRYLVNPLLEVYALAGVGVGTAPGTPTFRLLAGGSFGHVAPRRAPGESSLNCEPGLVHTPQECPGLDDDRDGVPNGSDLCPLVVGLVERKGCPILDDDNDGIENTLDQCPREPGPASNHGCPLSDADQDGIPDEDDRCPSAPGPKKTYGCPDQDNDGIADDDDKCKTEPGLEELHGCPLDDLDKDGVANALDSCINRPGPARNQGCPAQESPLVAIRPAEGNLPAHLELLQGAKIYFKESSVSIAALSLPLLDRVAQLLNEHPEIFRVLVGVHTDNRGLRDVNLRTSKDRAEEVMSYLLGKGVAPERVTARGFGPDVPIDTNITTEGRENNRRVEFILIYVGDPDAEPPRH